MGNQQNQDPNFNGEQQMQQQAQQSQPVSPQPAPNTDARSAPVAANAKAPTSAMAILGLVLGIIAILTSFVPIVNNFSFLLAILGIIFAIVGIVGTARGKKSGKGVAVAGLVINILAFIIVLATQALFSAAIDSAMDSMSGAQPVSAQTSSEGEVDAEAAGSVDFSSLAIGSTAELDDGLAVTINSVSSVQDYSGDTYSKVSVTYVNNGSEDTSFNTYDWSGQDSQGVQTSSTYIITADNSTDDLNSGGLAPGGTVTGNIYFKGSVVKIMYTSSIFSDSPTVTWVV